MILCVEGMSVIIERVVYVRGGKWDVVEDDKAEKDQDKENFFSIYSFFLKTD